MISFMSFNKMTDRSVVATCPLGGSLRGTGLPFGGAELIEERPSKASAIKAAVTAQAQAYAPVATINGAGSLDAQKQHQHHTMWAFRGLEPWRDPA